MMFGCAQMCQQRTEIERRCKSEWCEIQNGRFWVIFVKDFKWFGTTYNLLLYSSTKENHSQLSFLTTFLIQIQLKILNKNKVIGEF